MSSSMQLRSQTIPDTRNSPEENEGPVPNTPKVSDEPVSDKEIMKEILSLVMSLHEKTAYMQNQLDSVLEENKKLLKKVRSCAKMFEFSMRRN